MIDVAIDILMCPVCAGSLTSSSRTLRCELGHSFDVASSGHVNLTSPAGRRQPAGDTAQMVDARLAFLRTGLYEPLVAALAAAVDAACSADAATLVDVGSGPGFYSREVLERVCSVGRAVAVDISEAAMRRASRLDPRIAAVRANVRTVVPVRPGSADVVLDVFAPRNPGEWYRVMKPGASLIVIVPGARHLREMRDNGELLSIEGDKVEHLRAQLAAAFSLTGIDEVDWVIPGSAPVRAALKAMGPSAHHQFVPVDADLAGEITCDAVLLTFRKE